jgi:hypothetical protein
MDKILEEIKKIPQEHELELRVISMLVEISAGQAKYINMLKQEIQKLDRLNKMQAAGLRNRGIIS